MASKAIAALGTHSTEARWQCVDHRPQPARSGRGWFDNSSSGFCGTKAVAAGAFHSMILTQQGDVWVTGWNKCGQPGDGIRASYTTRFRLVIITEARVVAAGDIHSIVLKREGIVWAAGRN